MEYNLQLKHYYGSYRVTVSGDVTFTAKNAGKPFELRGPARTRVLEWRKTLKKSFPFLEIELREGIVETTLTVFASMKGCSDGDFVGSLCQALRSLANALTKYPMRIIMNFSGTIAEGPEAKDFRILNKKTDVQYKFVETRQRTLKDRILHSRTTRVALTILLILFLIWSNYHGKLTEEDIGKLTMGVMTWI